MIDQLFDEIVDQVLAKDGKDMNNNDKEEDIDYVEKIEEDDILVVSTDQESN